MVKIDNPNVPAFLRKRSLSAKARKKTSYGTYKIRKPTRTKEKPFERDLIIKQPIINRMPSETVFEEPLIEPEITKTDLGIREMEICGICEGYFENIEVAIITVTKAIRKGDKLIFEKDDGLFEQTADSIQINRKDVSLARAGNDIGIKIKRKPKVGTPVYKVI